jgi:hypothetical protein
MTWHHFLLSCAKFLRPLFQIVMLIVLLNLCLDWQFDVAKTSATVASPTLAAWAGQ